MQRRIFQVDGLPFVAARDGFIETHGTLAALIEGYRPAPPEQDAGPEAALTPVPVVPVDTKASATTACGTPDAAGARQHGTDTPSAKARKARTPRPKRPSAATEAAVTAVTAAEGPRAEETAADLVATPTRAPRMRVAGRRAGEPPTPRWMTAGKERRGRLK